MKLIIALTILLLTQLAFAADPPATQQYEIDLNKRGDAVLKALQLSDQDKAARVKQIVMDQYRAIRDADEKATSKDDAPAAKKPLHEAFVQKLSTELAPEQVETVKDVMTYNVVRVTYDAYCDELPQLTDTQKAHILTELKDARELAMDQGSSKEKHAVFGKAKGRINIYLSHEGYDLKAAEKEWRERLKARRTTQPST
jgi:hypothetical protein